MKLFLRSVLVAAVCLGAGFQGTQAMAQSIVMSSTTSTEQSGLFAHLLPAFKKVSGLDVKVVALGTGQALDMARRGDADVVFVHDQAAEDKFVADGFGIKRISRADDQANRSGCMCSQSVRGISDGVIAPAYGIAAR